MKLVNMICPNCGAKLQVNQELNKAFCSHCGSELIIDKEVQQMQHSEESGYNFEKGRQRFLEEEEERKRREAELRRLEEERRAREAMQANTYVPSDTSTDDISFGSCLGWIIKIGVGYAVLCLIVSAVGTVFSWGRSSKSNNSDETKQEVAAEEEYSDELFIEGDFRFDKIDQGYKVSANPERITEIKGEITIPTSCEGGIVTEVAESGFEDCTGITAIIIPDQITQIGRGAFKGCTSLESLTVPFVGLSENAQKQDSVLGSIFGYEYTGDGKDGQGNPINEKAAEIAGETWQVTLGYYDERTYYHYYIPESLTSVTITKQTSIPDYAFNNCTKLTDIKLLPNSEVQEFTFQDCTAGTEYMPQGAEVEEEIAETEGEILEEIDPEAEAEELENLNGISENSNDAATDSESGDPENEEPSEEIVESAMENAA